MMVALLATSALPASADEGRPHAKKKEAKSKEPRIKDSPRPRSSDPVVAFIDQQIRQGWTDNEVQPSAQANDEEWLRRVHLDLVGHIPAWNEIERFHRDKNPAKRAGARR